MFNTLQNEQLKFQTEMRSTITSIHSNQTQQGNKPDESVINNSMASMSPGFGVGSVGSFDGKNGKGIINQAIEGGGYGSGYVGGHGGYSGGGSGGGPRNWRYRKLDIPVFDGNDPDGWILRVERYIVFYRLSEEEILEAVVVALEGDALRWCQWEQKRRPIQFWADLKEFILRQFRPTNGGSLYEQWLSTTQLTTVNEYRIKFIETAAPLERVFENLLMGHFINGLKKDIKAEVRLLNPLNLEQAMDLAVRSKKNIVYPE